jgi:hypothetical protein
MDSPETPVNDLVTVDYDLADLTFEKVNFKGFFYWHQVSRDVF